MPPNDEQPTILTEVVRAMRTSGPRCGPQIAQALLPKWSVVPVRLAHVASRNTAALATPRVKIFEAGFSGNR